MIVNNYLAALKQKYFNIKHKNSTLQKLLSFHSEMVNILNLRSLEHGKNPKKFTRGKK